jgi:hypothetical protein
VSPVFDLEPGYGDGDDDVAPPTTTSAPSRKRRKRHDRDDEGEGDDASRGADQLEALALAALSRGR